MLASQQLDPMEARSRAYYTDHCCDMSKTKNGGVVRDEKGVVTDEKGVVRNEKSSIPSRISVSPPFQDTGSMFTQTELAVNFCRCTLRIGSRCLATHLEVYWSNVLHVSTAFMQGAAARKAHIACGSNSMSNMKL